MFIFDDINGSYQWTKIRIN